MPPCLFCELLAGRAPISRVYEDEVCAAFMDIRPVNTGHVLVVPRDHAASLADLNRATGGHLFEVGMRVAAALRQSGLPCEGVNFFLADGEAAGQEVFHVHLHVFPRYAGDGFGLKFAPRYFKSAPTRASLDETANQIREKIQK